MEESQLQRNGFTLFLSWEKHQQTNQSFTDAELWASDCASEATGEAEDPGSLWRLEGGGRTWRALLLCILVVDGSLVCSPPIIWKPSNERKRGGDAIWCDFHWLFLSLSRQAVVGRWGCLSNPLILSQLSGQPLCSLSLWSQFSARGQKAQRWEWT